jgi:hypothetical protein
MKRLRKVKGVSPGEATLRVWEEMRIEILHEIEDGGNVPDELVDAAGDAAMVINLYSAHKLPAPGASRIHVH